MEQLVRRQYLDDSLATFAAYKGLAEKAVAQVSDKELFATLDAESNSIAILMKRLAGNMISRWSDFLISDGEKPNRNRDMEFVIESNTTREELMEYWERGWNAVFTAVEPLTEADLERKVLIRGEEHSVVQAINRQLTHYAYHVGQIVFLAKHFRSDKWQSLSVPRNQSARFNSYMESKPATSGPRRHAIEAAENFGKK